MTRLMHSMAVMVALGAATASADDEVAVSLGVGSQKVLTIPGIQRVAIGDTAIADVKTLGNNQLLLIGSAPGRTSLLVWRGPANKVTTYALTVRPAAVTPDVGTVVTLGVGLQKVLRIPAIQRVAVGDSDVADVKPIGNDQLLIIGSAVGKTTLLVWTAGGATQTYTLNVRAEGSAPTRPPDVHDATPPVTETVALAVGASATRTVPGLQRVAVGDSDIADVTASSGGALVFKGVKAGRTTVLLWTTGGVLAWEAVVSKP